METLSLLTLEKPHVRPYTKIVDRVILETHRILFNNRVNGYKTILFNLTYKKNKDF